MNEPDFFLFRRGQLGPMAGLAVTAGLIVIVSVAVGFEGGLSSATIMFAGSVGIISSGVLDRMSAQRDRRVGTTALIVNAALTSIALYVLVTAATNAFMS